MDDDLTQEMLDDFKPFVKNHSHFKEMVERVAGAYGNGVLRIDRIPFPDGRPGIMEKRYFFELGTEIWDFDLNAITSGVESL